MRRRQFRRAVIDAGSSVEVELAHFNTQRVHVQTPAKPTLGWYVKQPTIAASAGLPSDTDTVLVDVRNDAIHNNITPTWEQTRDAIARADVILAQINPLP